MLDAFLTMVAGMLVVSGLGIVIGATVDFFNLGRFRYEAKLLAINVTGSFVRFLKDGTTPRPILSWRVVRRAIIIEYGSLEAFASLPPSLAHVPEEAILKAHMEVTEGTDPNIPTLAYRAVILDREDD